MSLEIIHKSLHRHQFFMGVDRELGMGSILIALITAMGGYSLFALAASVTFWIVAIKYLRMWTKKDPQIRDVFLRHIKYIKKGGELFIGKPGVYSRGPLYLWRRKKD